MSSAVNISVKLLQNMYYRILLVGMQFSQKIMGVNLKPSKVIHPTWVFTASSLLVLEVNNPGGRLTLLDDCLCLWLTRTSANFSGPERF
jgi:hypothetical protein